MVEYDWSVDSWAEVDEDEYCYQCADFVIPDKTGHCPDCLEYIAYGDEYSTASTSTTTVADAPSISSDGDMWGRSKSYTWGKGTSWWNKSSSSSGGVSSMWGSWSGGYNSTTKTNDAARMLKHKNHLDSLCKVVDPTVKHSLSFAYKGMSYSDMEKGNIVVDGKMLKDSDDNLDITAGLAIHEKLHLIHTKPILKWEKEYVYQNQLDSFQGDLLHSIVNTIEDEYIEKQLAKDSAGFVTYINSTKDYYFNEKQQEDKYSISEVHKNPYIDLLNTLLAFVRYPSQIDDNRKKRHAKHIRFFGRALKNGLDSRENTIECCRTLYEYLSVIADKMYDDGEISDKHKEELNEKMQELHDKLGDDIPQEVYDKIREKMEKDFEEDMGRKSSIEKVLQMEDGLEALKELLKMLKYSPEGMIDEDLHKEIEELEETDYEEFELELGKVIDKAQKKITWRKAKPREFERNRYTRGVAKMRPAINSLKKKINLYGNTEKHIIRNQKRGKLDKRNLHRIPLDRKDLFKIDMIREDKPLDVCLLVDESGSMGSCMEEARNTCIAVKEALVENDKLDLWVFGHTADGESGWHSDEGSTNMTTYWSPSMKDRPMAMGSMEAKYENRDGNAILAAAEKVKMESKEPTSNKLMIIFSDGSPAAMDYGGHNGRKHVKKCVKFAETQGWSIIQVGFGDDYRLEKVQGDMFDNHIFIKDTSQIGTKVSKIIRKVLRV